MLLLPTAARAVPPDVSLTMKSGTERFLRAVFPIRDVIVDPPGLVTAELMSSNEVFVTAAAAGKGRVTIVAIADDQLLAWDLCVAADPAKECATPNRILEAKAACPDLESATEDGQLVYRATVKTPKCHLALRDALTHAPVTSQALRLVLEEEAAVDFTRRVIGLISADPATKGLKASFLGPTLRLSGTVTRESLGRVTFDSPKPSDDPPQEPVR